MRIKFASVSVVLVLVISMMAAVDMGFEVVNNVVAAKTWYVDDVPGSGPGNPAEDFTSIQDAIDAVPRDNDDTIYVYSGTYTEMLDVYKMIKIIGEDRNTTIIQWNDAMSPHEKVVSINSFFVDFSGFTIHWGEYGIYFTSIASYCSIYNIGFSACSRSIYLDNSHYNDILNNVNTDTWYRGISLYHSSGNVITNNNFINGGTGIFLESSNNNEIISNNFSKNNYGIQSDSSNGNIIENNIIENNENYGIYLSNSNINTIEINEISLNYFNGKVISNSDSNSIINNDLYNNNVGVNLQSSQGNTLTDNTMIENGILIGGALLEHWNSHDIGTTNSVNNKPVYYWKNQVSGIVPSGAGEIILANCTNITITDQELSNGSVGIEMGFSTNNLLNNTLIESNSIYGAYLFNSSNNTIMNINTSDNLYGLSLHSSDFNVVNNSEIFSNGNSGIYVFESFNNHIINSTISSNLFGIYFHTSNLNFVRANDLFFNSNCGIRFYLSEYNTVINCSLSNEESYDLYFRDISHATTINTNFNKSKVYFFDTESTLTVKWFLHINVSDYQSNPVPNAAVKVEDNYNGSYNETFTTNTNGYLRWIPLTEYIEQKSGKTYYTPHIIKAWNETLIGYAYPYPLMDLSKYINITLYNGTLFNLEPGWNLISFPRYQSNPDIQTVLQSIEGRYDSVQWYNESDTEDPWKYYHISKPSSMNDLEDLDSSMGLWLHITDPQGATLVVFGDKPTTNQTIQLYEGWNLVGYPSLTNHNRTVGLNNLEFGTEVDAIQWFDSSTKTWHFLEEGDSFEVGRGYWIHATTYCVWEVPL